MGEVRIDRVRKTYQRDTLVLKDVSFAAAKGEFITLLGPSGCGKSTLLRSIAGLETIDAGAIYVGDRNIVGLPPKDRGVGMVFQSYALFPNLTVYDNIAFGLKMERMPKKQYGPLVDEMIELIDMKGKEDRYPAQLSGGQQQRVALARSLVKRPEVLLLDEPLSALDAKIRRSLRQQLRLIQRKLNMTTIFVTHDQEEALTLSDRIVIMKDGATEQIGSPEEIYTRPATEFVARFIGSYNVWRERELTAARFSPLPQGALIAVRPEAIAISPLDGAPPEPEAGFVAAEGTVELVTLLGSVLRFTVNAGGLPVTVDQIHRPEAAGIREGMKVRLAIPADECREIAL